MWWKKKEYRDYYNEGFLQATFAPKENLAKLKRQYEQQKSSASKNSKLKAIMAGFMAGLKARNESQMDLIERVRSNSAALERER